MQFKTEIHPKSHQQFAIDFLSKVLLMGSCFSENIGQQLQFYKFQTLVNPFGTLFHPLAIERVLTDTVNQKVYQESDLVKSQSVYHSLHHHTNMSDVLPTQVVENIHKAQQHTLEFLQQTTHIIITLGTAWVYEYIQNNEIVANCHKTPQTHYQKHLLSVSEISDSLHQIVKTIRGVNKNGKILFTLSPVRHLKDGFTENSLSKAHLLTAIHELELPQVFYFPSYEIVMDDLRDYRFYEADMVHPNALAIQYVWEKFCLSWMSQKSLSYFAKIAKVQQGLLHKPMHQTSEAHQQFLASIEKEKQGLQTDLGITFE